MTQYVFVLGFSSTAVYMVRLWFSNFCSVIICILELPKIKV